MGLTGGPRVERVATAESREPRGGGERREEVGHATVAEKGGRSGLQGTFVE
jgi:hypothetical protein